MISESGSSPSIKRIDTYQLQTDRRYRKDAANKNAVFQSILSEPPTQFSPFQEYVTQTVLVDDRTEALRMKRFLLTIVEPDGSHRHRVFGRRRVTIGSSPDND